MTEIVFVGALSLAILVLLLVLGSPGVKGARGERRVSAFLRKHLAETDYRVLDDLTLPARGATTQVDHVVISRFGVFVVETKNMTGWIFGGANQARWTQAVHRKKSPFQNPLHQNYGHVKTVETLTGLSEDQIHNVVVFVGDAIPKSEMPPNVSWGCRDLLRHITAHQSPVMSADQVGRVADLLTGAQLERGAETRKSHLRHVKALKADRGPTGTKCPTCGGDLVMRTARKSGKAFLGCTNFPRCKGMRQVAQQAGNVADLPRA